MKEEASEKPPLLDFQQNSTRVFFHPQNPEDSVHPTNQEYVVVNPDSSRENFDPSREDPVPSECPQTIFLEPSL